MADENLFEEQTNDQTTDAVQTDAEVTSPADQLLGGITNEEGKQKYSSVEDALKALKASQDYIKTLEGENKQYKDKLTSASTVDDILRAVKGAGEPPKKEELPPQKETSAVSLDGLTDVVAKTIADIEARKVSQANQQAVSQKLKEVYGEKAKETLNQKAKELGLSGSELSALASKSPAAFYKVLGVDSSKKVETQVKGVNTETFSNPAKTSRSAMAFGSTKDLLDSWNEVKREVNEKLGIK